MFEIPGDAAVEIDPWHFDGSCQGFGGFGVSGHFPLYPGRFRTKVSCLWSRDAAGGHQGQKVFLLAEIISRIVQACLPRHDQGCSITAAKFLKDLPSVKIFLDRIMRGRAACQGLHRCLVHLVFHPGKDFLPIVSAANPILHHGSLIAPRPPPAETGSLAHPEDCLLPPGGAGWTWQGPDFFRQILIVDGLAHHVVIAEIPDHDVGLPILQQTGCHRRRGHDASAVLPPCGDFNLESLGLKLTSQLPPPGILRILKHGEGASAAEAQQTQRARSFRAGGIVQVTRHIPVK